MYEGLIKKNIRCETEVFTQLIILIYVIQNIPNMMNRMTVSCILIIILK